MQEINLAAIREQGNLELLARQMVEGFITGLHKSPYHGFSVEFAEHRLYNTGESTRYIDWKVYAKTDRLYVKRFEEETNLRCALVVDSSPSMYYPSENNGKITFSFLAAASLAYLLQKQRDAVGLFTFAETLKIQSPIKSTGAHLQKLLILMQQELKKEPQQENTRVAENLHIIAEKIHKRSLVVIFSDMFQSEGSDNQALFSALNHLKHKQNEVLLFHVTDKATELEFDFEDRPYRFIDLETGEKLKLTPTDYKKSYREKMEAFYKELKIKCGQLKIDFIEADIQQGVYPILQSYLIKRAKMK